MENKKEFLGTEPIGKLLLKLAIPTVVAQLINMLYNIVDRIYIGHMPGDGSLALTGVGVCMPIILIVTAFASLISSGGAPRSSIFMGQGDLDSAEKTLGGCFALQVVISVILTAVILLWNRNILLLFGASDNTISYATSYMSIYALGTLFVQMTLGMNMFITAQGFTKVSMLSVVIGAVTNIILDPILIFGLHMGVRGAALATITSQGISFIWVMKFLCGKDTILKLKKANIRISPKIVLPCLALGSAAFIMQASESIIAVCFNSSLLKYGGDLAVGTMTILTSVMQFVMLPLQGIGQGAQPITSFNFGAKNKERVQATFKLLLTCCLTYATIMWALILILPQVFVGIFTPDSVMITYAARMLRVYIGAMCLFGIQIACQMTFTAIGNALSSIVVAVVRKFVLLIPLIYIVPIFVTDKTLGVFMAEPIADALAVLFTVLLFRSQFKKALESIS